MASAASAGCRSFELAKETELRLEVSGKPLLITLDKGRAEVFGCEMKLKEVYSFEKTKIAIFTWFGATLTVVGDIGREHHNEAYKSDHTPMRDYVSMHGQIDQQRAEKLEETTRPGELVEGPRVAVVGPEDTGKSTLCRILLNYAVRLKRCPIFVELDLGQGEVTMPGCVSATPVDNTCMSVVNGIRSFVPLVYFSGDAAPSRRSELFKHQISRLGDAIDRRMRISKQAGASGLVVNTCGWTEGLGYELLVYSIKKLRLDVVLVMEDDRLLHHLSKDFPGITVTKMKASGGRRPKTKEFKRQRRDARIQEYFNGISGKTQELNPIRRTINFADIEIYEIGGEDKKSQVPNALVPLGHKVAADPLRPTRVDIKDPRLRGAILAVSRAKAPAELKSACVAGFVHVQAVHVDKGALTVLAPCDGKLPGTLLIMGSIRLDS